MVHSDCVKKIWRGLAPILALACFGVYAIQLWQNWKITQFDDSYMFVRYANQLLNGNGMSWNPDGKTTYGATSLPYVWALAGILRVFSGDPGSLLVGLSWFFGFLGVVMLIMAVGWATEHAELKKLSHITLIILPSLIFQNVFLPENFLWTAGFVRLMAR